MGHDRRPKMDTYSVSDIGRVNPSYGIVPSATCTCWRQPLSQECVLFSHMLFSRHKIRQGYKMFLLPKFIIAPLQGAMVSQFKYFKKKIYHKGLEINFSMPPKISSPYQTYTVIPMPAQKTIFFKTERQHLFTILHRIFAFTTVTQVVDEKELK